MANGETILYTTEDNHISIQLKAQEGTVWLTQAEVATLFETTSQNITLHIKNFYKEQEQPIDSTCKEHLQVRSEGNREVQRKLKFYNLNRVIFLDSLVQV